jgi:3-deoxy-D-manno-octulosonic-acid transferase
MNPLLRLLYGGAGQFARLASDIGAPGDGKLARSINARRDLLQRYAAFAASGRDRARPLLWFHAPSVGEGLQATPVMSRLREQRPDIQLAYTHFSPSAESFAKRTGADFSDYLPFDIASEMRAALLALQPSALIFSKLDVWPVLAEAAAHHRVPLAMISATLAQQSARRGRFARAISRDAYAALHAVGAIDDDDAARLVDLGVRESVIRVTGDTRYDQVWRRAQLATETAPWLSRFRETPRITLVAGSTWPADEAVLLPAWRELVSRWPGAFRLIIAPHEPTNAHLAPIESWASFSALRCARLDAANDTDADVVLVDRVGVLGDLYAVADVAYVGGGFHAAGLHSVIEPAAFGVPVLFGPQHLASRDAALLLQDGGAQTVDDVAQLASVLTAWIDPADPTRRRAAGAKARARVEGGVGAADRATALVLGVMRA